MMRKGPNGKKQWCCSAVQRAYVVHRGLAHLAVLLLLLARWRHWTPYIHPTIGILGFFLRWLQDLEAKDQTLHRITGMALCFSPGMSTIMSRPHSSSLPHCQTRHNNLAPRTASPNVSWQRIHIHPRQPVR